MTKHSIYHTHWLFIASCALLALTLALSACDQGGGHPAGATKSPAATVANHGIRLGQQPCPASVQAANHWNAIAAAGPTKIVEGVICGYLMGIPSLQAVLKIGSKQTRFLIDVDVFTSITGAKPVRIFALTGLVQGDVNISKYNTLLTSQIDPNSSLNKGHPASQQLVDLYREFKWSDSGGTLAPVAFQGLFPDTSRFQAEYEQYEVNNGQGFQQWRLSATTTAQNFAEFALKWTPNTPTTVLSGGGTHDIRAVVLIKNPSAGGAAIRVALSRLELNANGGIWEVTGVATDGITITSPQETQQLSNPAQVTGTDTSFTRNLISIIVEDHDRAAIGQATVTGQSTFAIHIPYSSTFQNGTQEGTLALYTYTASHIIVGAVMVKVLLNP
jgi:hypothetical protein